MITDHNSPFPFRGHLLTRALSSLFHRPSRPTTEPSNGYRTYSDSRLNWFGQQLLLLLLWWLLLILLLLLLNAVDDRRQVFNDMKHNFLHLRFTWNLISIRGFLGSGITSLKSKFRYTNDGPIWRTNIKKNWLIRTKLCTRKFLGSLIKNFNSKFRN